MAEQVYRKYIDDKEAPTEIAFENTFELIIIWINRLLFIKLFEGQLVTFNSNESCYRILDNDKIESFQNLQDLFFNVLGKRERTETEFYNKFSEIPYLNSSLFEKQEIEKRDININDLKNAPLTLKSHSVLANKKIKELPLLQYIIDFLNSYDFGAYASEEGVLEHGKDIIDASVLGLIFEKINGYKDGSFYTPSEITEYMNKETLERIVIQKINQEMHWHCKTMDDLKFEIDSARNLALYQKLNEIINSIRICDPAVGSGHFLVSALNRLIAIKADLGVIFIHGTTRLLRDYDIYVNDDTLIVEDAQGQDFVYDKNSVASQQIQETLFVEKKTIIEECLFGVDLNAKAVHICQLRLWIELLKNAYYKNGVMETLPNIDIDIKVGNSLINKIPFVIGKRVGSKDTGFILDSTAQKILREYKKNVKAYKSESNKAQKEKIKQTITNLKENMYSQYFQLSLFEEWETYNNEYLLYENALEWAIEFPEILSEEGVFLGFDCIIGNPPILRGRDVKRYSYDFADKWIIATHNGNRGKGIPRINIEEYPAIKKYLDRYYEKLAKRVDKGDTPYNLRNCVYMDDFSKQKIVWGEISDKTKFALDGNGDFYCEATTFLMTGSHLKYLLCFLNSKFSEYYFSKIGTTTGVGTVRWKKFKIETLPVPVISPELENAFERLLDNLLAALANDASTTDEEHAIDVEIYNMLKLSDTEIEFIENFRHI